MTDETDNRNFEVREAHAQRLAHTLVKQYETFHAMPTKDAAGVMMLGYQRRLEHDGISQLEADMMLSSDLKRALLQVRALVFPLMDIGEVRIAVITHLALVLGADAIKTMTGLWLALRERDFEAAADAMLLSDWPTKVGHTLNERRRAIALANAMRTGVLRPAAKPVGQFS